MATNIIKKGKAYKITIVAENVKCNTDWETKFYTREFEFSDYFETEDECGETPQQATQEELKNYYEQDSNGHRFLEDIVRERLTTHLGINYEWDGKFEMFFGIETYDKGTKLFVDNIDEITHYECNDCGHEWKTTGDRPKCENCRSEDWEIIG